MFGETYISNGFENFFFVLEERISKQNLTHNLVPCASYPMYNLFAVEDDDIDINISLLIYFNDINFIFIFSMPRYELFSKSSYWLETHVVFMFCYIMFVSSKRLRC